MKIHLIVACVLVGCTVGSGAEPANLRLSVVESVVQEVDSLGVTAQRIFLVTAADVWTCLRLGRALRTAARDSAVVSVVVIPSSEANDVAAFLTTERVQLDTVLLRDDLGADLWAFGGSVAIDRSYPAHYRVLDRRVVDVDEWVRLTSTEEEE